VIVRPASERDASALRWLERDAFGATAWSEASIRAELKGVPASRYVVVAETDEVVVGYAVLMVVAGTADVLRVVVATGHRCQGIGRALISELLAETQRPLVVSETGLPNRLYVPREDVAATLRPGTKASVCPYKGRASYWSVDGIEDAAWSYEEPLDGATRLRGHVAFDEGRVEVVAGA